MIAMKMGNKDVIDAVKLDFVAVQLQECALAAIHQKKTLMDV